MSQRQNLTTRATLAAVLLLLVPTLLYADQASKEQLLAAAKSTLASQIEPGLPEEPIEYWLQSIVEKDAVWSWELNDCGEQSGNPEIDKDRDMPICGGIEVTENERVIYLYFLIGFNETGIAGSRELYFAGVSQRDSVATYHNLSTLAAYLQNEQN